MATTITSPNTNDVVNWAYKYSLACAKLNASESAASSSATRSEDIATAKADFNATMKSLVPSSVQTSVQFQYMDALTAYNTELAAADTEKERQTALTNLYSTLGNLTIPSATSTTLEQLGTDTLTAQKTNLSNAAASIKSMLASAATMASNASSAWLSSVASGANILNTQGASATDSLKSLLTSLGLDTSGITAPTVSTQASSSFAAGSGTAVAKGTPGTIMNAALIGYLVANEAANTS